MTETLYHHESMNIHFNFDNTANAMQTWFAASTTEGWFLTLLTMVDSSGGGLSMQKNNRSGVSIILVLFMILVSLLMLNLFIGVVIVTCQEAAEKQNGDCILDKGDRESRRVRAQVVTSQIVEARHASELPSRLVLRRRDQRALPPDNHIHDHA